MKEVSPPIPTHILQIQGRDGILPVKNLGDINKKDMISHPRYAFTSPSSGLDALLYTVNELKPDEVNIVGLDFYDNTGYFTTSNGRKKGEAPMEVLIKNSEPTDVMHNFFKDFVISKPHVTFNLYTLSNIECDIDNLNITKVII